MGKEKALLSFIAVFIGLLVAGIAFYFYENSKTIPSTEEIKTAIAISPSPTPQPSMFLTLNQPKDEEVVQKKIITISGKTTSDATIVILAGSSAEEIISPASNGDFSTTTTIENGQNLIEITAIALNKEKVKVIRTVTFSTEEF
jgi:hypothetical protein